MKQLEEIKARASAASEGPWAVMDVNDPVEGVNFIDVYAETDGLNMVCRMPNPAEYSMREWLQADAEFIAAARTDAPKLVAALEAVEDIMTWLDMVEEVHPSSAPAGSLNVSAAGTAAVIRKVINKAMEAA